MALNSGTMDKTILLHEISPEDLRELIRQAVRDELELKVLKDEAEVLLSRQRPANC